MIAHPKCLLLGTVVLMLILAACGVSISPSLHAVQWQSGYYTCARWSWNGEHLAALLAVGARVEQTWVADKAGAHPQQVTFSKQLFEYAACPAWLPDNRHIAFVVTSNAGGIDRRGETYFTNLCLTDTRTSEVECFDELRDKWYFTEVAWHPVDPSLVALVYHADTNIRVDSDTILALWRVGEAQPEPLTRAYWIENPVWSSKGDRLVYRTDGSSPEDPAALMMMDYIHQTYQRLEVTVGYSPKNPSWSPDDKWLVFVT